MIAYKVLGVSPYNNTAIVPYEAVVAGFCSYNPRTCVWPKEYFAFAIQGQLYAYLVFDEHVCSRGCGLVNDDYKRYQLLRELMLYEKTFQFSNPVFRTWVLPTISY